MDAARLFIIAGLGIAVLGVVLLVGSRVGCGRLPGDIIVSRGNFRFAFPIVTSLLLSVVLTVVLNVILRAGR